MREPLLNAREVSKRLSVHPKTVYAWKSLGLIPSIQVNGLIRFDANLIERFLERGQDRLVDIEGMFQKVRLPLDAYDRLHLKGGRGAVGNKARRRWNYGFGSVYLRKTKEGQDRWAIDYQAGGKRIREVVKDAQDRGEAVVALKSRLTELFNGRFNPVRKAEPLIFSRLADIYIGDYAKTNKKSWRCDDYALKAHLTPFFGEMRLNEITPHVIERYRAERLRTVRKSSTNREVALLKTMFCRAVDWGFAEDNPVRKIKMFSERDNLKERILTDREETRLLAVASDRLRPILLALLHTGARRSEILGLTWADVDLEARRITFRKTKAGKNRTVSVNTTLLEVLRHQRETSTGALVFPGPRGQRMVSIQRAYEDACEKAGIEGLRLHDIRHTFATRLLRLGVDIVTLQGILGHYSIDMTRRYLHTDEGRQRDAVERLVAKTSEDLARVRHAEAENATPQSATEVYSKTSERVN